jgi:hypothetical protein
MSITLTSYSAQCPFCPVRKHQIDGSQERAIQVVRDAINRHVAEEHAVEVAHEDHL